MALAYDTQYSALRPNALSVLDSTPGKLTNPLRTRPNYFVRSGYIIPTDGKSWNAGILGHWWTSRSYSNITATYYLGFYASDVYPSNSSYRYYGFPLRCLSTVLDM